MKTTLFKAIFLLSILVFVGGAVKNAEALSYASCSFYRDLYVGSRGEDVRCLQQYLQSAGYGSVFSRYGTPDGVFGPLTQQSLIQWQISNGLTATGYFDAISRARLGGGYYSGVVLGTSTCVPSYDPRNGHLITDCGNNYNYGNNSDDVNAWEKIEEALIMIEDAEDEIDDVNAWEKIEEALIMIEDAEDEIDDSNDNTNDAEESLEDAKDDIYDAVHAYFVDRDFNEAYDRASDALDNAEDAYDDAGGHKGNRRDAEDAIDDARDAIDDARDEIEDADDDGDDVDEAEDLLDEAEDLLEDAEDEFDDEDYDNAEELADEAREMADDAVDAIN